MGATQTGEGEQKEDLKITVSSKGKQPARESTAKRKHCAFVHPG